MSVPLIKPDRILLARFASGVDLALHLVGSVGLRVELEYWQVPAAKSGFEPTQIRIASVRSMVDAVSSVIRSGG